MDFFHFNSQFKKKFLGQNDVDDAEVHGALKNLETITPIKDDKFVAGDNMTIADFSIFNTVTFLEVVDFDISNYPKTCAWVAKIKKLQFASEVIEAFEGFKAWSNSDDFVLKKQGLRESKS